MQRSRLTTVLTSLGLACGPERAAVVEPDSQTTNPPAAEPSGLGSTPKPEQPSSSPTREPHFAGVPTQFCHATLQARNDPLLKTASLLQAWHELAPTVRNPLAHNIPATETDARIAVCGTERVWTDNQPKLARAIADYMVGIGVLIPDGDGTMLVVPEIAAPHRAGECQNETTFELERHGQLIHVRASTREQRYNYGHYHGYGYNYEPRPIACQSYATFRRDLIIDATRGELELIIDQQQASEDGLPWIELSFDEHDIVLTGCGSALELQWTE